MSLSLRLGRILGIPVGVNYSWFIIFILITVSLSLSYFPNGYPNWSTPTYWAAGIITSLLFFGSVLAHELSHSVIAIRSGIPVKSITLFVLGGVAQIAREATRPQTELVMAAAGPLSSVAIAMFFGIIWFITKGISQPLGAMAGYLAVINVMLAAFNIIPGFPLDGGRVLRAIIWMISGDYRRATKVASFTGQGIAYLFIALGIVMIFAFGNFYNGIWLILIGWFLENAASGSYRQMVLQDSLRGFTARDLMTKDCPWVPHDLSLRRLVSEYILPTSRRCFLVTNNGVLEGIVTLHNIKGVPQQNWDTTTVDQAMTPLQKLKMVKPEDEAVTVLERMDEEDVNQMPVVEAGEVIGMIGRDNVLHFLRTRSELGM